MPGFLKVRSKDGPKHTFYAPVESVEAWPDDYEVLDPEPVAQPGPEEHVVDEPVQQPGKGGKKDTETSVGNPESEGDA
jgi:hypothetical protein